MRRSASSSPVCELRSPPSVITIAYVRCFAGIEASASRSDVPPLGTSLPNSDASFSPRAIGRAFATL